jgi:hypothetical protein
MKSCARRCAHSPNDDLIAVREAVAQWRAGDAGTPLDEAFEEVRRDTRNEP